MTNRIGARSPDFLGGRTFPGVLAGRGLLIAALVLAGCSGGGGNGNSIGQSTQPGTMRAQAIGSVGAGNAAGVTVDGIVLKAERRVSRTVFEYDFEIDVKNVGAARSGVIVQLIATGAGTTVAEGGVAAGDLAADSVTTPVDIITIRHDRTQPFQPGQLQWKIDTTVGVVGGTAAVGAALANANVSVTDTAGDSVCAETKIVTTGTGAFTCTVVEGKNAPFLVVVTDPSGGHPPMVSVSATTPAPNTPLVVNATPLTSAIIGQLAPNGDPLTVVADPSLIDLNALADITNNVLTQLAPVLTAIGTPPGYDPFSTQLVAATLSQAGNTADQVIELLRFSTVNGVPQVYTIDNPAGAVAIADAANTNPPVLPPPSATVLSLSDSMRLLANTLASCFSLPVNTRVLATDTNIPASQGGPKVTQLAPECQEITHPGYLQNGYVTGQQFYGPLLDASMVGATFSPPEIMLFIDDATPADNDQAVLNIRYVDANGIAGNFIEAARKIPGVTSPTHPSEWWIFGNQLPVDTSVRSYVRRSEQFAPNPGTPPFANASASRFEAGIVLFINKDGPGSTGMRAARVKGPGLPLAGVVLTRPDPAIITNQNWLDIRRKDGNTDPAAATFATSGNNIFRIQRTQGVIGAAATTVRPNPNAGNSNNTSFVDWAHPVDYGFAPGATNYIDFSQLAANTPYTVEIFYDGEITPRHTLDKLMLTPVVPATLAVSLQWISLTADALRYLDPADPLAAALPSMNLGWIANPFAETIRSAGVYTFGGGVTVNAAVVPVDRGATSTVAAAPGGVDFRALTNDGTSGRYIQLRYRTLDGAFKDSMSRFN